MFAVSDRFNSPVKLTMRSPPHLSQIFSSSSPPKNTAVQLLSVNKIFLASLSQFSGAHALCILLFPTPGTMQIYLFSRKLYLFKRSPQSLSISVFESSSNAETD